MRTAWTLPARYAPGVMIHVTGCRLTRRPLGALTQPYRKQMRTQSMSCANRKRTRCGAMPAAWCE